MLKSLMKEMDALADARKAAARSRFFKTGKGEYGEGDAFLGIRGPEQRRLAKKYRGLDMDSIRKLLGSKCHEHRQTALFILTEKYRKSDENGRRAIFNFYLSNTDRINNWDLVDLSAPSIAGDYLASHGESMDILYGLAKSSSLWERRIAVLSTFAFIRKGRFEEALEISETLLADRHDLIRKAVGWMLREIGKRDQRAEERFLRKHCKSMPRVMLRYAIERFPEQKRKMYM